MEHLSLFKNVLELEAQYIQQAANRVTPEQIERLIKLYEWLSQTGGNLIISGVGKSGVIAQKIAATFSSLGLPSFFLHPTEALHGDLGRVTKSDVMVLISKSGTTEELQQLLPFLQLPQERLIALVGNVQSPLAHKSGVVLDCSVPKEACLNDLAPTTSTTVTMAMGDAMAVLYESVMEISKEKFALNHPGGLLGKSLSLKVEKLMVQASDCPQAKTTTVMHEALLSMTKLPVGMLAVTEGTKLVGILVEGDIRRALTKDVQSLSKPVGEIMNQNPVSIPANILAYDALKIMEGERPFSVLPVIDNGVFKGVLRLHDLLRAGFVAVQPGKK